MTIQKKAQKEIEGAIMSNPSAETWSVQMGKTNLKVMVVLADSEKGKEIIQAREEGRIIGAFIFEEKEYLVTR